MAQKWGKSEKMKTVAGHFLGFVWLKCIQIHFKFNKISISCRVLRRHRLFGRNHCHANP